MAFIVEDGTGKSDANAGISVEAADAYHEDRGNKEWEVIDDEVKQQLIVKATDYVELTFFTAWAGAKSFSTQAMASFPRIDGYYRPIAYIGIQRAIAELALIANSTPLFPNSNVKRGKAMVKVGPVQVQYDPAPPTQTKFVKALLLLSPFLNGYSNSGPNARLERR